MKRKKLYSVLALGMAVSLMASVPVSAAGSINTGTADFPVKGEPTTEVKDDGNEVSVAKGENDKVVFVEITAGDSTDYITEAVKGNVVTDKKELDILNGGAKLDVETATDLAVPETVSDGKDQEYLDASMAQFEAVTADEIKIDKGGYKVQVTPVALAVQSVAAKAAKAMAEALDLKLTASRLDGSTVEAKIELAASADISIPDLPEGQQVRVTIPMTEKPDTARYVYYVLHYNDEEKRWETLPASVNGNGIVVATFNSFSPVFVVKAEKVEDEKEKDDGNNDESSNDADDSNDDNSSVNNTKVTATPAAVPANPAATPANPAVSPKTGE